MGMVGGEFCGRGLGSTVDCDVVLLDLGPSDGNGLDLTTGLRQRSGTHALVLSVLGDETSVLHAIELGQIGIEHHTLIAQALDMASDQ
jgi:DNA-binding NarL/FixJ family response regulator